MHQGILPIDPIDLLLMVRRLTRNVRTRKHKKYLGKSIDLRDEVILRRKRHSSLKSKKIIEVASVQFHIAI